jgi:hypothetical protein
MKATCPLSIICPCCGEVMVGKTHPVNKFKFQAWCENLRCENTSKRFEGNFPTVDLDFNGDIIGDDGLTKEEHRKKWDLDAAL